MELFEIFQQLNRCHGPSGDEGGIRAAIAALAAPYADECTTDTVGNLIVHKRGSGPKVMLCAHMDSIGFMVTHFEKDGFLRVGRLGGISPKEVLYSPVRFQNGVRGAVVMDEKAEFGKLTLDDLLLDIGAESEEQARTLVQLGDTAVCDAPAVRAGSRVISPYLDNRICCAVLLEMLSRIQQCRNDLYVVFSVQEEVGLRGAKVASYAVQPDYALAVDVTTTDDVPGGDHSGTVQLGKGAAVKLMDSSVICHPAMVEGLEALGRAHGIPTQREVMRGGGTDAGAIHLTRTGVITGGVSVPCRYIHTPVETADLGDAQACVQLLAAFAQSALEQR